MLRSLLTLLKKVFAAVNSFKAALPQQFRAMRKYLFFEAVLPGLLVFIVWMPAGVFGLKSESHLFYKVFATGDLLPICLLILINAYLRVERANNKLWADAHATNDETVKREVEQQRASNDMWRGWLFLFAVALFLLYYSVKVAAIPYPFPPEKTDVSREIVWYTACDVGAFVFVTILGCFTLSKDPD